MVYPLGLVDVVVSASLAPLSTLSFFGLVLVFWNSDQQSISMQS